MSQRLTMRKPKNNYLPLSRSKQLGFRRNIKAWSHKATAPTDVTLNDATLAGQKGMIGLRTYSKLNAGNAYMTIKCLLVALTLILFSHITLATNDTHGEQAQRSAVNETLDALHQFASAAKGQEYFSLFADTAIYIGTDANETWSLAEFKAYVDPYFKQGKGWTYTLTKRHIYFAKNKQTAWFDELLHNKKYGVSRGTGVLIYDTGRWKIAQYHLTFPIPNALAAEITEKIKGAEDAGKKKWDLEDDVCA